MTDVVITESKADHDITLHVDFQWYGESDEDRAAVRQQVRDTLVNVASLCALAVGTSLITKVKRG